ncbi:MAG: prepilin-type N-terminal cleavage/methylation domain-containing protein [Clostridia bacterium]|jgi:prepilin-type N-terminal cleavage/methylation domain-containing protein|nr:prepilin-type N-terminal cleavage/methylation domain-containing protein [Clostridia bacterium]MCI2014915.1 prepilin-type N-terminal cleavage/methylation domain-containing protein [Clostridia bacterium]
MKKLFDRKNNKKGFTLAELLIVVAIIAVLVAISIPVFTSKLEKAREATDVANMRAAKAVAVAKYLDSGTDTDSDTGTTTIKTTGTFYYDAAKGELVDADTAKKLTAYGKGTSTSPSITYGAENVDKYTGDADGKIIEVFISDGTTQNFHGKTTDEGVISEKWVKP